jgi:hypothetical protein
MSRYDTVKAEAKKKEFKAKKPDASKIDILKATIPCYWKTAIVTAAVGAVFGVSGYLGEKEFTAMAATTVALSNQLKAIKTELGEKESKDIFDKVNKDGRKDTDDLDADKIVLWHEAYGDKWFKMSKRDVEEAEFKINELFEDGARIPYNMVLRSFGLRDAPGYFGNSHGWGRSYDVLYYHPYIPFNHIKKVDPKKGTYYEIVYPIPPYDFHMNEYKPPYDEWG